MDTMENPNPPKKIGRPKSHGMIGTPTYAQWALLKQSCNNPKANQYKYVGGRGIGFCARWRDFKNFLADMGEKPEGSTLQRRNRDRDFSPENCFWQKEQKDEAG